MSYILDALRRAERERSTAAPQPQGAATAPATPRPRPTILVLAATTLFLAGVGVAALLLRPPPAPLAATPTSATSTDAAPPTERAASPAEEPLTGQPLLGEIEALGVYETLDDVTPVFQGSPTRAGNTPLTDGPTPVATLVHDSTPASATQTTPPTSQPMTTTGAPGDARRAQRLDALPTEVQSRFASPLIQVHVFDADPARRWIMVDSRRVGEGGQLDGGLRIAEIVADGVIFEFEGQRVYWPLNR
ncbi:general secretion pathway protein GspB [Sinimarinibacterium thermocellulolyticum]|uniref:General secretion pathway protein GspB n=1 Tax=Sinimarinibacterium thermocellulolyticum TaxID=3170016 RepID=A0ABV2A995_9GAMM